MNQFKKHIIKTNVPIKEALVILNELAIDAILFVVKDDFSLVGSITDGDIRRALIDNKSLDSDVIEFVHSNPKFIMKGDYDIRYIVDLKKRDFKLIPVVDENRVVVDVINLRELRSYLPLDALIMAGGIGSRLKPLTDHVPKPLLEVNDKPIIEYNTDRMRLFGISNINISIKYLGDQLINHYKDGEKHGVKISYIEEKEPLGTIGALSLVDNLENDFVLVMNSDLLTNIDFEDFFIDFIDQDADMAIVSVPYHVDIPYAVLETEGSEIKAFSEKPTYTYYSNGGIYLMKKEHIHKIPSETFFNATDLMELLIEQGKKVISYPLRGYWLDIGKHEDFARAQEDVKHIQF